MADIQLPSWTEEDYFSLSVEARGLIMHGDVSLLIFGEACDDVFYKEKDAFLKRKPANIRDVEYFRKIEELESMMCSISSTVPVLTYMLEASLGQSFVQSVIIEDCDGPLISGNAAPLKGWSYLCDSSRSYEDHIDAIRRLVVDGPEGWSLRDLSVVYIPLNATSPDPSPVEVIVLPTTEIRYNCSRADLCLYNFKDRSYRVWDPQCTCVKRTPGVIRIQLCCDYSALSDSYFVLSTSGRVSRVFMYALESFGALERGAKKSLSPAFVPGLLKGGEVGVGDLFHDKSLEEFGLPYRSAPPVGSLPSEYKRSWLIRDVSLISRIDVPCVYGIGEDDRIMAAGKLVSGSFFWVVTPRRIIGVRMVPASAGKLVVLSGNKVRVFEQPAGDSYFYRDAHRVYVYSSSLSPSMILDMCGEAYESCSPDDSTKCLGLARDAASWIEKNEGKEQSWIVHNLVAYLDVPLDPHESYYFSGGRVCRTSECLKSPWTFEKRSFGGEDARARIGQLISDSPGLTRKQISDTLGLGMSLVATIVSVSPFRSIFVGQREPGSDYSLQRRFFLDTAIPVRRPLLVVPES